MVEGDERQAGGGDSAECVGQVAKLSVDLAGIVLVYWLQHLIAGSSLSLE